MAIRNRFPTKIPVKTDPIFLRCCVLTFGILIAGDCAEIRERSQPASAGQIEVFSAPRNYHVPIPHDN